MPYSEGTLYMSDKFNQLIELLIAEDTEKAEELFHDIVVERSRSIYENLIDDEEIDESDDEAEVAESDFDEELGGDAADDLMNDIQADENGLAIEADEGDEEIEDRVVDLEDALDELKAEFDKIMGDDDEEGDMDMDMDMEVDGEEEPEMDMDMDMEVDAPAEEEDEMEETFVREYTEKVAAPSNSEEGDASSGPVANKNDMGGKAASSSGSAAESGGSVKAPSVDDAGNVNKPGAKVKQVAAPKAKA
jgi:hypothetical protein